MYNAGLDAKAFFTTETGVTVVEGWRKQSALLWELKWLASAATTPKYRL